MIAFLALLFILLVIYAMTKTKEGFNPMNTLPEHKINIPVNQIPLMLAPASSVVNNIVDNTVSTPALNGSIFPGCDVKASEWPGMLPGPLPTAPYQQIAVGSSLPYQDTTLIKANRQQLINLLEMLKGFLAFEAQEISERSDPTIQLPLQTARTDFHVLQMEVNVLNRNPGIQPTITLSHLNEIASNLSFLQRQVRLIGSAGPIQGPIYEFTKPVEGFVDSAGNPMPERKPASRSDAAAQAAWRKKLEAERARTLSSVLDTNMASDFKSVGSLNSDQIHSSSVDGTSSLQTSIPLRLTTTENARASPAPEPILKKSKVITIADSNAVIEKNNTLSLNDIYKFIDLINMKIKKLNASPNLDIHGKLYIESLSQIVKSMETISNQIKNGLSISQVPITKSELNNEFKLLQTMTDKYINAIKKDGNASPEDISTYIKLLKSSPYQNESLFAIISIMKDLQNEINKGTISKSEIPINKAGLMYVMTTIDIPPLIALPKMVEFANKGESNMVSKKSENNKSILSNVMPANETAPSMVPNKLVKSGPASFNLEGAMQDSSSSASLQDISNFIVRLQAEAMRLSASGTTDPVTEARVVSLAEIKSTMEDLQTEVKKGLIPESEIPISRAELEKALPILGKPSDPLPQLIKKTGLPQGLANLLPSNIQKDPMITREIGNLADNYLNTFINGLSWQLKYTSPREAQAGGCSQSEKFMNNLTEKERGKKSTIEMTGFPSMVDLDNASNAMFTPMDSGLLITDRYAPLPSDAGRGPSHFDWYTRSKEIEAQVKKRGLNPADFGIMSSKAKISKEFSWRGYTRMMCTRLQATMDPHLPVLCGCPPMDWPGWRNAK